MSSEKILENRKVVTITICSYILIALVFLAAFIFTLELLSGVFSPNLELFTKPSSRISYKDIEIPLPAKVSLSKKTGLVISIYVKGNMESGEATVYLKLSGNKEAIETLSEYYESIEISSRGIIIDILETLINKAIKDPDSDIREFVTLSGVPLYIDYDNTFYPYVSGSMALLLTTRMKESYASIQPMTSVNIHFYIDPSGSQFDWIRNPILSVSDISPGGKVDNISLYNIRLKWAIIDLRFSLIPLIMFSILLAIIFYSFILEDTTSLALVGHLPTMLILISLLYTGIPKSVHYSYSVGFGLLLLYIFTLFYLLAGSKDVLRSIISPIEKAKKNVKIGLMVTRAILALMLIVILPLTALSSLAGRNKLISNFAYMSITAIVIWIIISSAVVLLVNLIVKKLLKSYETDYTLCVI